MKTADLLALVRQPGKCFYLVSVPPIPLKNNPKLIAKRNLRIWIASLKHPEYITVTTGPIDARGHCTKTFHYNPSAKES